MLRPMGSGAPKSWKPKTAKVCVVSRTEFSESSEAYPIKSRRELRKLLEAKHGPRAVHWIGRWRENQRVVLTAVLKSSLDKVSEASPVATIPETWLLSHQVSNGMLLEIAGRKTWFFFKAPQGYETQLKTSLLKNDDAVKAAMGAPKNTEIKKLTQPKLESVLLKALARNGLELGSQSLTKRQKTEKPLPIKAMAASVAGAILLYLAFSSAYLNLALAWAQSSQERQSEEVAVKMQQRQVVTSNISKIEAMNSLMSASETLINIWDVIGSVYLTEVQVNNLSSDMRQIELNGVAESATELARELGQLSLVSNVELTSPVRKGRTGEVFSMRITVTERGSNG